MGKKSSEFSEFLRRPGRYLHSNHSVYMQSDSRFITSLMSILRHGGSRHQYQKLKILFVDCSERFNSG